mmetsp:Transcript_60066/g.159751  ORF Transcript_60066/g.159751 Transcript_60066/m.159751 type:complete len:651 (-) Transcript_60066:5-1957(-)
MKRGGAALVACVAALFLPSSSGAGLLLRRSDGRVSSDKPEFAGADGNADSTTVSGVSVSSHETAHVSPGVDDPDPRVHPHPHRGERATPSVSDAKAFLSLDSRERSQTKTPSVFDSFDDPVEPYSVEGEIGLNEHMATYKSAFQHNPWVPTRPVDMIEDFNPVAPMDQIVHGIRDQNSFAPEDVQWASYHEPKNDELNPFPKKPWKEKEVAAAAALRGYKLQCVNTPFFWYDRYRKSCDFYMHAYWCTWDGHYGRSWYYRWGTFSSFRSRLWGTSAKQSCCACGGGAIRITTGKGESPLIDRRLFASGDRLPQDATLWLHENLPHLSEMHKMEGHPLQPLQAPEDRIPLPIPAVAPLDVIPPSYSLYLNEVHMRLMEDGNNNPPGFSVRYYEHVPGVCTAPDSTAITSVLEYSPAAWMSGRRLAYPLGQPITGIWWGKWSGTISIFKAGVYHFNLDIGFPTDSTLRVDGFTLFSQGQCRSARDSETCARLGCNFGVDGTCKAPSTPSYWYNGSYYDGTWTSANLPYSASMWRRPYWYWNYSTGLYYHYRLLNTSSIYLTAGRHCIQSDVRVTAGGQELELLYSGADTDHEEMVIPSSVTWCDPVIDACVRPQLEACRYYQPAHWCARPQDQDHSAGARYLLTNDAVGSAR